MPSERVSELLKKVNREMENQKSNHISLNSYTPASQASIDTESAMANSDKKSSHNGCVWFILGTILLILIAALASK